jgi:dTMP kinase
MSIWAGAVPFVSFEGIDGSGKTSQLELLADWLERQGHRVVRAKEPDGGRLGRGVRALLTARREAALDPLEELLLVSAARVDHVRSTIRPALAAGYWVLCDRFLDSSFAFQFYRMGMSDGLWREISTAVVGATLPDLTFILDIPPHVARDRLLTRSDGNNACDPAEATRDFQRIRDGFKVIAALDADRCRLVDASGEMDAVADAVRTELCCSGLFPESGDKLP